MDTTVKISVMVKLLSIDRMSALTRGRITYSHNAKATTNPEPTLHSFSAKLSSLVCIILLSARKEVTLYTKHEGYEQDHPAKPDE
jgi:hypothetical protein